MNNLNKAVFFDRDGVINKERKDYVKNILELEIFPETLEVISKLKKSGFLIIVITNQSAINRGLMSHEELKKIHQRIQDSLLEFDCKIDAFYYCPHSPDENCNCRKPNTGLFENALNDFKIDLSKSWMIGDHEKDILAAKKINCKSILISDRSEIKNIPDKILHF